MAGNSLDIEDFPALHVYLRDTHRIAADEIPVFTNLAGGVSNRTVLVQRTNGQSWVLKQALERLRVAVEWVSDPRRIEREALGMQVLAELAPPGSITPLIFLDRPNHLLAMQAVPQPHANWKSVLLSGRIDQWHIGQFARLLGAIHLGGWNRRQTLGPEFNDRSFFESLRIEPYYLYSASEVRPAAEFLNKLVTTTRATRYTLVHGDFSPKNVLVHDGQLILLDHEVIHFGDGAFDLGFSLAHLLSKAHHKADMRTAFADAARSYWQVYLDTIGKVSWAADLEPRAVAHTLGCLLARCRGRSPLEYLDEPARQRQAAAVVDLMAAPPSTMVSMIDCFVSQLS